jgi:tetratricopeptide (TPR) repeat protein
LRAAVIVLMLMGAAWPGVAVAQQDVTAQARRYFQSASKHFDLGEYREALDDFKSGYRLREDPVFLYNIAQCERLLGRNVDAIRTYKSYLRRRPDAPNRDEVEKKIEALEQAQRSQERASSTPPNQVMDAEGRGTTEHGTTEHGTTGPTASQATTENAGTLTTSANPAPPPATPLYKKWWLWTVVGVVVVGVAVGVGVGVAESKASTPFFPGVQF